MTREEICKHVGSDKDTTDEDIRLISEVVFALTCCEETHEIAKRAISVIELANERERHLSVGEFS